MSIVSTNMLASITRQARFGEVTCLFESAAPITGTEFSSSGFTWYCRHIKTTVYTGLACSPVTPESIAFEKKRLARSFERGSHAKDNTPSRELTPTEHTS